jgi:hypothetical protein
MRPAFDAAAGHPHREAARVVVAAVVLGVRPPGLVARAAEFAAPDDEGVVEHAALLQVLDQAGAGLVDVAALGRHAPATLLWWSQLLWKICTKRTPRSARRRAINMQFAASVPGFRESGP